MTSRDQNIAGDSPSEGWRQSDQYRKFFEMNLNAGLSEASAHIIAAGFTRPLTEDDEG